MKALRKAQVPLDAPGPELVARLKEEFGKSRDIDLAVVFSLGKTYDPAASDALGDIERRTGDKDVKKRSSERGSSYAKKDLRRLSREAWRRSLHRYSSQSRKSKLSCPRWTAAAGGSSGSSSRSPTPMRPPVVKGKELRNEKSFASATTPLPRVIPL